MGRTQQEEKLAVECGYWHLYRHNPLLEEEGKNPMVLDSNAPDWSKFQNFLNGEVRYTSLKKHSLKWPPAGQVLDASAAVDDLMLCRRASHPRVHRRIRVVQRHAGPATPHDRACRCRDRCAGL